MTHVHPHTDELRRIAADMNNKGGRRTRFTGRLKRLLAVYAEHGCFRLENLDEDLVVWARYTISACVQNCASDAMQQAMLLLRLDRLFKTYRSRAFFANADAKSPASSSAVVPKHPPERMPVMAPHLRVELLKLAPPNLMPNPDEDIAVTAWWAWMWVWRTHVTDPARPVMGDQLARFRDLSLRMRSSLCLSPLQGELVDLLAKPYRRITLGEAQPAPRLKLVGAQA